MTHATANNHAQAWRTRHEYRDAAEWQRNLERAARAGFPRTQRGVRSALVMSVWQSDRARWERHLLVSAHVNTAAPLPRHREDAWWRQRQRSAILARFPLTPRDMRSRLVWRVMQYRDEWHLICAHVNTAPPPTFAHEPVRVAVQYQLEATAPSLRPEPPATPRVIDAATEFARQQCIALVKEMKTWGPAA